MLLGILIGVIVGAFLGHEAGWWRGWRAGAYGQPGVEGPRRGVQLIEINGLPEGYKPPSASLRHGLDVLDPTPVPPQPFTSGPVVVHDVND